MHHSSLFEQRRHIGASYPNLFQIYTQLPLQQPFEGLGILDSIFPKSSSSSIPLHKVVIFENVKPPRVLMLLWSTIFTKSGSVGSYPRSQSQSWAPECGCGDKAVVRTATTIVTYGRKFWGCKNFRPNDPGCNYIDWYYEGVTNERDQIIMRQKSKIEELRNNVNELRNTVSELKNNVNELRQKPDEATSSMNAQNHIVEAQNRKIVSLEISLSKSKKMDQNLGDFFCNSTYGLVLCIGRQRECYSKF